MSLSLMKRRLLYQGGAKQHERLVKDKLRSFNAATKYSYQAAHFRLYPDYEDSIPGLFNPVTQTMDYDTKLISIPFESGFKVGTVFNWEETDTHWICYSQDRTEQAYFKGSCRRCDYVIKWVDERKNLQQVYASIMGPNQPYENIRTQNKLILEQPNANLTMYVSDSIINHDYFAPGQQFILKGQAWEINNINDFSMPGIIMVYAVKTYANLIDNDVEQDIHNAWNIQPVMKHSYTEANIDGPATIQPLHEYEYTAALPDGEWLIVENKDAKKSYIPVEFLTNPRNQRVRLKWAGMTSGSFTLAYTNKTGEVIYWKHIIVESLM